MDGFHPEGDEGYHHLRVEEPREQPRARGLAAARRPHQRHGATRPDAQAETPHAHAHAHARTDHRRGPASTSAAAVGATADGVTEADIVEAHVASFRRRAADELGEVGGARRVAHLERRRQQLGGLLGVRDRLHQHAVRAAEVGERREQLHHVQLHRHEVADGRLPRARARARHEQPAEHPELHRGGLAPVEPRQAVLHRRLQLREPPRQAVEAARLGRLAREELHRLKVEQRVDDNVLRHLESDVLLAALCAAQPRQRDGVARVQRSAADDAHRDGGHAQVEEDRRSERHLEDRAGDLEGADLQQVTDRTDALVDDREHLARLSIEMPAHRERVQVLEQSQ